MKIASLSGKCRPCGTDTKAASVAFAKKDNDEKVQQDIYLRKKSPFELNNRKKNIIGAVLLVTGFSLLVPAMRNKLFYAVDPCLIDISKRGARSKRDYILFADQVEVKRDLTANYFKESFGALRDIVSRNFFSYNEKEMQKLTPIAGFPKKLVECATNQVFRTSEFLKKFAKRAEIDYTYMNNS